MVRVDRAKCGYCGSCVSLCPVAAINLAETRLQVNECCTECEQCVASCPLGGHPPHLYES